MNARGYSTEFEAHRGLLGQLARKAHDRLTRASVSIEYGDVFQSMCETYVKAAQKYDPQHGITFTAYLGRAVWNEFNKLAERLIRDALLCQQMPGEDFEEVFYDLCENTIKNPDEVIETEQCALEASSQLSPEARFFVNQLVAPSAPILRYMEAMNTKAETARKMGIKSEAKGCHKVTLSLINRVYEGVTVKIQNKDFTVEPGMARKARREINKVYGLESEAFA